MQPSAPIYQIIEKLNGTGCDLRAKLYEYIQPWKQMNIVSLLFYVHDFFDINDIVSAKVIS